MENLALYRKYRPRDFSEVIGQEHIVQTIQNAIAQNRLSHAYLFTGPRGTGKTTLARILAKTINCEKLSGNPRTQRAEQSSYDGQPCGKCISCMEIAAGRALDIIEIDAASNRGIDEIRELREGIRSVPVQLKYKVYIIDESHQLTKEAFNALLKTLEEPPAHAVFILATTEADKMPATILSRVQRFDFKQLSIDQIVAKLEKILKEEKVKFSQDALRIIATYASGGLRDAESMLAQILAHSPDKVTDLAVEEALGVPAFSKVATFADLLQTKDLKETIIGLNSLQKEGVRLDEFLKSLLGYLRKMMLLQIDEKLRPFAAPELTDNQFLTMIAQCKKFDKSELEKALTALMEAEVNLKKTSITVLPIELALIKIMS